jgi:hypothetical protein
MNDGCMYGEKKEREKGKGKKEYSMIARDTCTGLFLFIT